MNAESRQKLALTSIKAAVLLVSTLACSPSLNAQTQAYVRASASVVAGAPIEQLTSAARIVINDSTATIWRRREHPVALTNGLLQVRAERSIEAVDTSLRPVRVTLEYAAN